MASSIFLIVLVQLGATMIMCYASTNLRFPAILLFGDSTVDTGNNNYISTLFKCNHAPYGINFPNQEATGRFSDGKLVPDFLAAELGIKQLVPPYLHPNLTDDDVQTGVCFASAGSGFDELTTALSNVIPVMKQPKMLKQYLARLTRIVGEEEASKIINEALILISAATNDFTFNFYDVPLTARQLQFNISGYQDFILQKLQVLVKEIYGMGGRKFVIASLPPVGCLPIQMTAKFENPEKRTCVDKQNSDSIAYNLKLEKLVSQMQASLPGTKVVYASIYDPAIEIVQNPQQYGFKETKKGCCGTGFLEVGPLCTDLLPLCSEPSKFWYWDAVHSTEAAYKLIAKYLLDNYIPKLF